MPGPTFSSDGPPEQIVDVWVSRLIQRPIEPARRDVLIQSLGSSPNQASVSNMIKLILSMPEYQLC